MRKHLTPNLEPKSRPEELSWNPALGAEHMKTGVLMRIIDRRWFDIHAWPGLSELFSKLIKFVRIMMPNIAKIPCSAIAKERQASCFLLIKLLVMLNRTKNRNEAYRAIELRLKYCWRAHTPRSAVCNQIA